MTQTSKQSAAPELGNLRKQVEDLKNELALTRTRLEEQAKETFQAKQASDEAQAALTTARHQVERLESEVSAWRGEGDSGEGLLTCLSHRGLKGEDERRDALMALGERRELDGLLKRLKVVEPSVVQRQLARRLILCCDQEVDRSAVGVATVVVGSERCELCGGQSIEEHARRFVSGLLNMGWRRCTVYGGPDWAPRAMQKLVHHSRLEVQLIPWSTISMHGSLPWDDQADCVVLWRNNDAAIEDWMNGCPGSLRKVNSNGKTLIHMFEHAGSSFLNIDSDNT